MDLDGSPSGVDAGQAPSGRAPLNLERYYFVRFRRPVDEATTRRTSGFDALWVSVMAGVELLQPGVPLAEVARRCETVRAARAYLTPEPPPIRPAARSG